MERPPTRWVEHEGHHIAYQVSGRGEADLLLLDLWMSNLDSDWDWPGNARVLRRLEASVRLVRYDRSGMGLSDRRPPDAKVALDAWADEAIAVLDAAEVDRFSILALGWCGPLAITIAARYPDRVERLGLHASFARLAADHDHPGGLDPSVIDAGVELVRSGWGTGVMIDVLGMDPGDAARAAQAHYERAAVTPGDLEPLVEAFITSDVRHLLADVTAPTLVTTRNNPFITRAQSEYLAASIPDAELRDLEVEQWDWPTLDEESLPPTVTTFLAFLTGSVTEVETRRRLLCFVFMDVVGSTRLLAAIGDREWSDRLELLNQRLDRGVTLHGGRLVNRAGDGYFCVFESVDHALAFATDLVARSNELGIGLRTGVHAGECVVVGDDLRGIAIHAAARIMSNADEGEILASNVVRQLAREGSYRMAAVGEHELRGVPGRMTLHRVDPAPRRR